MKVEPQGGKQPVPKTSDSPTACSYMITPSYNVACMCSSTRVQDSSLASAHWSAWADADCDDLRGVSKVTPRDAESGIMHESHSGNRPHLDGSQKK